MAAAIDAKLLAREWIHSHEEDTAAHTIYRPAGFSFPPSRGRRGFELRPDGTMIEKGPGPTDRTQRQVGTWRLTDNRLELLGAGGRPTRTLTIDSVDDARLVILKSPSAGGT